MKPENRETTTIELAAVFYVGERKNPLFEICMQCCKIPRNCTKCCKNPLHLRHLRLSVRDPCSGLRHPAERQPSHITDYRHVCRCRSLQRCFCFGVSVLGRPRHEAVRPYRSRDRPSQVRNPGPPPLLAGRPSSDSLPRRRAQSKAYPSSSCL